MDTSTAVIEMPKPKRRQAPPKRERGEGGLIKRGNVWWIQYFVNGQRVRESSKSESKQVAVTKLQEKLLEVKRGEASADANHLTYEAMRDYLYDDYRTHGRKSMLLKADGKTEYIGPVPALDEFFKEWKATAITTEAIKKFVRSRQEAGIGNGGINGSLAMLRRMFWLQARERKFPRNLIPFFPMLEKPKGRRDFLTPGQHAALLKHLPDHLKPLQVVAYDTGARKGELLKLTWSDVDLKAGTLVFHETKNGEDRLVPLGKEALKTLKALAKVNTDGAVFTRNGQPIRDFRHAWKSATKAAGVPDHLFHGNRRSQAVNLMASGVDEQTAMAITGHKDSNTFRNYRVLVEAAKRAAITQRDAAMKGGR